jgi:hypothetical protein
MGEIEALTCKKKVACVMRWGRRIAVCSVLGVATTVAVAWALAAFLPQRGWKRIVVDVPQFVRVNGDEWLWVVEFRGPGALRR